MSDEQQDGYKWATEVAPKRMLEVREILKRALPNVVSVEIVGGAWPSIGRVRLTLNHVCVFDVLDADPDNFVRMRGIEACAMLLTAIEQWIKENKP